MRWLLALALAALPAPALANGAFPDTAQVLLPADRPQTIVLGTNFGLVISEDGGAHWRWSCEHGDATGGYRYTLTTDQRRIVGLAGRALVTSQDLGCTWTALASQSGAIPFDFFPDSDPAFALVLVETLQTRIDAITRVDLRAPTAPQVLYEAPTDEQLTTVEVARADPRIVYATLNPTTSSGRTRIVRSTDGGQSWADGPIDAPADAVDLRIAAVDPRPPTTIYFRAGTPLGQGESLVVSDDGGKTARTAFTTPGALAALLPLVEGGVLFSVIELGVGRLYRWEDGIISEVPAHISARGFAERGGVVYAATDNVADGFALARSGDRGRTWERVMGFGDIAAISGCGQLPGVCAASCSMLAMRGAVRAEVCSAPAVTPMDAAVDAGTDAAGVLAADAGVDGAGPSMGGGCSCRAGSTTTTTTTTATTLFLLLLLRRGRGGRGPS